MFCYSGVNNWTSKSEIPFSTSKNYDRYDNKLFESMQKLKLLYNTSLQN
jgi:hypothetical protein